MARIAQDKPYVNFVNGFITEATGITFPENALQDVDNCDIELKGSIKRRYGLDIERGGVSITSSASSSVAVSTHIWDNAAGDSLRRYVVIQVGNSLVIRKRDVEPVSTSGSKDNGDSVTLSTIPYLYNATESEGAAQEIQSASGFGRLWLASPALKPIYIEYDVDSDNFILYEVGTEKNGTTQRFFIRDFTGVDDGLQFDEEQPDPLTNLHLYNLLNQGWRQDENTAQRNLIQAYRAAIGTWPTNAQQWVLGKNSDDNFDAALLRRQEFGNSPAPKGRFKLNPLTGVRNGIATFDGLTGSTLTSPLVLSSIYDEPSSKSYRTTAFFSGRVWYAGDVNPKRPNGVYFSKVIQTPSDSGVFGQENDPTSEHFTDLLDTDGGVVYIPEADSIERLIPFQQGMLVMAKNGVWYIRGSDSGFRATDYGVDKLSSTGCISASSVIQADTAIAFFAENSVHVVTGGEFVPKIEDIAEQKILQYYAEIPLQYREKAKGTYDPISKKMFWFHATEDETNLYNACLILDARTGAFTKYSFFKSNTFGIVAGFASLAPTVPVGTDEVVIDEDPVLIGADPVITSLSSAELPDFIANNIKVLVLTETDVVLCEFASLSFKDFGNVTNPQGQAINYTSYLVTIPETLGDLQRYKQSVYLHSLFLVTEMSYLSNGAGSLFLDRPSGCTAQGLWDWHKNSLGNRFSQAQQAYRFRKDPTVAAGSLDNGEGIVYTKLKVRGKGRSLAIRYESQEGKDFVLIGYSIPYTANGL